MDVLFEQNFIKPLLKKPLPKKVVIPWYIPFAVLSKTQKKDIAAHICNILF